MTNSIVFSNKVRIIGTHNNMDCPQKMRLGERSLMKRGSIVWVRLYETWGFPGGASGKEPRCQCRWHRRPGFDSWVGKIPWRRAWQPTPVFLPGESHEQRSLVGLQSLGSQRVRHDRATNTSPKCIQLSKFSELKTLKCILLLLIMPQLKSKHTHTKQWRREIVRYRIIKALICQNRNRCVISKSDSYAQQLFLLFRNTEVNARRNS